MKTRARKAPAPRVGNNGKQRNDTDNESSTTVMKPMLEDPPKIYVLPKAVATDARIVTVNISLSGNNTEARRYLVCPSKGTYEFTKVSSLLRSCRSWLLVPGSDTSGSSQPSAEESSATRHTSNVAVADNACVLEHPDMFLATPMDPLYLLLAVRDVLWPNTAMGNAEYLSIDTRLGILRSQHEHLDQFMRGDLNDRIQKRFSDRIKAVCDVQEIPGQDDPLYHLSIPKLYAELVRTGRRVVKSGLPASMEDKFVSQPLRVPELLGAKNDSGASEPNAPSDADQPGSSTEEERAIENLESAPLSVPSAEATTDPRGVSVQDQASHEVRELLRLRTIIEYVMASYLPAELRAKIQFMMCEPRPIDREGGCDLVDFAPLNEHLARVNSLKQEVHALRSLSDNISRKRSAMEDDEAAEKTKAKKRKKEEEEIKKKNTSRGVQQLAKADTSGMKKLSAFFSKAPAKTK